MAEPEDEAPPVLLPCSVCSRTFKPESLQKHLKVCEKQAAKKRKVFDSSKQRIQGTELAEFLPKILREKKSEKVVPKKPESNWKEKHLEFVAAIRAARGVEPASTKSSSAVSKSSNEKCPHCDRNFGPKAFDRHIEWCKEQKARIPKSPASLIQAKERLEARTKYRAPPLAKSKRTLTREKYARVSQHSSKDSSPLGSRSAVAFSKPQPQEVKGPETISRIPGIRNKPKLSSSSPSCTLPSGNAQVKKREPSPSPSKRPYRNGSKTAKKVPIKPKNETTNSHASLFTSSCNITKIQPSEERHRTREVKPNPVESRAIARKSSLPMPKQLKRKGDLTSNPMEVGAHSCKGDKNTNGAPVPADEIELHEKTNISCDSHNSLLGESLLVKGTVIQQEEEDEDQTSSENMKRFRTNGTRRQKLKLNDIDVNKENDGLFVSPCSIFQSSSNLLIGKDSTRSKQGLKAREDSDLGNEVHNTTITSSCPDDDIEMQKLGRRSQKQKIICEQRSEGMRVKTDNREEDLTKLCVDSPRYGAGDSVCQKDIKLPKKVLVSGLPSMLEEKTELLRSEELSSVTELNKCFDAQEIIRMENRQEIKIKHFEISESSLSANEVNDNVYKQHKVDCQSCLEGPMCIEEIEGTYHNGLHLIKERFDDHASIENFPAVASISCEECNLQDDVDVSHSSEFCQKPVNAGGEHLTSRPTLFASKFDHSAALKDILTESNLNEQISLPNGAEHCVFLQKFPCALEFSGNTDMKTNIDCKGELAKDSETEIQRECSLFTERNESFNGLSIKNISTESETVNEMGDIQNYQVCCLKERLSQNLKAFDLIFSASEFESSDISTTKFNEKSLLQNEVGMTHIIEEDEEEDLKNSLTEVQEPPQNSSNWESGSCEMQQDLVPKHNFKSGSNECSAFSQILSQDCDFYDFPDIQIIDNQVSPRSTENIQKTVKEEENASVMAKSVETLKQGLNNNMLVMPLNVSDTTEVKGHLSLLSDDDDDDDAQKNVSHTSVFSEVLDESNKTKINHFINNSINWERELKFSHTNKKSSINNISTLNKPDFKEFHLPDVLPDMKDSSNINCNFSLESPPEKDPLQQCFECENFYNMEESRNFDSLNDGSSVQFSDKYGNILAKDSVYDDENCTPFCKNPCTFCFEKDKIHCDVCNVWKSCKEEEPDLFYKFDLPDNLVSERCIDSPTDRIWDLASQEFIKNVKKTSGDINLNLNVSIESYLSDEGKREENNKITERQKMLHVNNYKRKNSQLKMSYPVGPHLLRGYFAVHQSQRRNKKKIQSSAMRQMKRRNRRISETIAETSHDLKEPVAKKHFSIICENMSDISLSQENRCRNTMKNCSSFNLSCNFESEHNAFNVSDAFSRLNAKVINFDQIPQNSIKNMIKNSQSNVPDTDILKYETIFNFQNHHHLHCNSIEENENSTLETANENIVSVETSKKEENGELNEALSVYLSYNKKYVTISENVSVQRIVAQNEKIFRYSFDVMKFYMMSELLCSGILRNVISTYRHCVPNRRYIVANQCLRLPLPPVSDKFQSSDLDVTLESAAQDFSSTVSVFYDVDESFLRENLCHTYVMSQEVNDTYFSARHRCLESVPSVENNFPEIDYLPIDIFKDNTELSSGIEEEEYREIVRNCLSEKSNENFKNIEYVPKTCRDEKSIAEFSDNLRFNMADKLTGDKKHIFEFNDSDHCFSKTLESPLQNLNEHADTDSYDSNSEINEFSMETLPTQNYNYESDEDVTCNLFPEILGVFETSHLRNYLNSQYGCEYSPEFVNGLEFDFLQGSRDFTHLAFDCVDNSLLELFPFYSEIGNEHSRGVVITEVTEETEGQFSDEDLHNCKANGNIVDVCTSQDKSFTSPFNVPELEEKYCSCDLNYLNKCKNNCREGHVLERIKETDCAQTVEIHDAQNLELHSADEPLSTQGTSSCSSDLSIANVCYHYNELDRMIPMYDRSIFCLNFPSFLYNEDDDFDVKIWTNSFTSPWKNTAFLPHSFQSSSKKYCGAEDEEKLKKFDFHKRLAQNMMMLQQNNDNWFEDTNKRNQEHDMCVPKRKKSASFFKEEIKSTAEKHFNRPTTSGTNIPQNQTHRNNASLYDLAMNVKGVIQSEREKLSEGPARQKHKIKSAKEHDMSLLKLVEKWSTKDKILTRPKTMEGTSKKTSLEYIQSKQQVPKIHRLPPLSSPPKCSLQNSSSSEEVYDPYVSAERQMMELLSQGDFTQLSPRQNKSIPSSQAESSSTVFPSFESSHRSAFVRYSPSDLSHLSNETAIPPSLIAEFEDLFIGSQKSNYINDNSIVTDEQNQNIHISLSDIGQNLSNNNVDTIQPVRKPSKIRAKMENAALSLQRSVSLMNYENDMKVGTEASSLIHSDGDNNPLPTLSELSSFPFSSPEPPRVFPSSKSHLEKGDADKRINEEAFMLKSESSISSELFTQLKSHSAGGKFSADSAYGSLNRRSPTHSTGKQMPGKHEEMEGDRLCFMSSSSSESSLPPLCTVQVVTREASNPSLSPSPPHAVDASPVLQSVPRMSKFCHECGSKYPVSLAKFCCECGVRRLAM